MAEKMSVIHKQVISMASSVLIDVQTFEVPIDASMCEIDWDTRDRHGIAFWYTLPAPEKDSAGEEVKFWRFMIRGTGHPYPSKATHLATMVRDGFAWHVLDADGGNINWAEM